MKEEQRFYSVFDNFLKVLITDNSIDDGTIEKIIDNILLFNEKLSDKDYLLFLLNSFQNVSDTIYYTINNKIVSSIQNSKPTTTTGKYIQASQLYEVIGIGKAIIVLRSQSKYFQNSVQKNKGDKLMIPYSDVDFYCQHQKKYWTSWNNYK